jgi:hypothetical protein
MTDTLTTVNAFRVAADFIDRKGYTSSCSIYQGGPLNVSAAFEVAAELVGCFTDELERAFAGWLELRGIAPAGLLGADAAGRVAEWETDRGGRNGVDVTRELRAAADALATVRV